MCVQDTAFASVDDVVFGLELSLSLQHNSEHLLDVDPLKALLKDTPKRPIGIVKPWRAVQILVG